MFSLLADDFNTLYRLSQRQFSRSLGLHLNSKDWKAYIDPGQAKFYNFLLNGIVKTTTTTRTDKQTYNQIIQFSDYKMLENALLLMFIGEVPQNIITHFMATFLYNTQAKMHCSCPAFKFYGFEYILTRKRSVYGPGEYRPARENNPHNNGVYCKHLWIIADRLYKKQLQLTEGLVPFYKRVFGINTIANLERVKAELGFNEINEIFEKAKKDIDGTREIAVKNEFNRILSQYLNDLGKKKLKAPEVHDQKDDNTEEMKEAALKNTSVVRDNKEKSEENEKTIKEALEKEENEGELINVEE